MKTTLKLQSPTLSCLALFPLTACLISTANASFISNGSFETAVIPANTVSGTPPTGWSGGFWLMNGSISPYPNPQHGNQFVNIGFGTALQFSQTFSLATAGSLLLTWHDNAGIDANGNGYQHSYAVLIDGNPLNTYTDLGFSTAWNYQQEIVMLSAGSHTLSFIGDANYGADVLLDNVSLTAVPEPSTYVAGAMLLLPLGARWIRRARNGHAI